VAALAAALPVMQILRGGVSVDWDVVLMLLTVEDRGGRFTVTDGKIRVLPSGILSADERTLLSAQREEVLRVLAYDADTR
jgi:hypothetical protein